MNILLLISALFLLFAMQQNIAQQLNVNNFEHVFDNKIKVNKDLQIKLIASHQIEAVKNILLESAIELWQLKCTFKDLEESALASGSIDDIMNAQEVYLGNNGTFLVLLDGEKVVGSGGIRKITNEICELKRLWFLKEYRGLGFGFKMATELLEFAKSKCYKKVRLDVWKPESQAPAIALYKKLGFYEIEPYNDEPAGLFMEKII
jgi:putative acetyltransferase